MQATFVGLKGDQLTVSHPNGDPDSAHSVDAKATVTLNGKPAKLTDLKAGDSLSLSGDPVVSIAAKR